jgi:hypothetical protein
MKLAGQWISFWGLGELTDIKQEANKLSFVQVSRFGEREFTATLVVKADEEGKLTADWQSRILQMASGLLGEPTGI